MRDLGGPGERGHLMLATLAALLAAVLIVAEAAEPIPIEEDES